jgi:hypothetical protein
VGIFGSAGNEMSWESLLLRLTPVFPCNKKFCDKKKKTFSDAYVAPLLPRKTTMDATKQLLTRDTHFLRMGGLEDVLIFLATFYWAVLNFPSPHRHANVHLSPSTDYTIKLCVCFDRQYVKKSGVSL